MQSLVGKTGRVTGTIKPGSVGEVTVAFGGGTNTYHAMPDDGKSTYEIGAKVTIIDVSPPQTVYVF
jgi:hypothetical protein